jgi:hypothetical protein
MLETLTAPVEIAHQGTDAAEPAPSTPETPASRWTLEVEHETALDRSGVIPSRTSYNRTSVHVDGVGDLRVWLRFLGIGIPEPTADHSVLLPPVIESALEELRTKPPDVFHKLRRLRTQSAQAGGRAMTARRRRRLAELEKEQAELTCPDDMAAILRRTSEEISSAAAEESEADGDKVTLAPFVRAAEAEVSKAIDRALEGAFDAAQRVVAANLTDAIRELCDAASPFLEAYGRAWKTSKLLEDKSVRSDLLAAAASRLERHDWAAEAAQVAEPPALPAAETPDAGTMDQGEDLSDPIAEKCLAFLRDSPDGMTKSEIRDRLHRNKTVEQVTQAVNLLLTRGLIKSEPEVPTGKPSDRFFAMR